jgi:hypothetical protein
MTRSLPLETFRRVMGLNPLHFWGLVNSSVPVTDSCAPVLYQYSWQQADQVGRDEIARAIEQAETTLAAYLGYSIAPTWKTATLPYPRFYDALLTRFAPVDVEGRWVSVNLSEGYINAVGIETLTLLTANQAVVLSDKDGDGINDTFMVGPVATAITDSNEIVLSFASTERYDGAAFDGTNYRIDDITASISAGMLTITGPAWVLVKPVRYQGFAATPVDPAVAGNFASTVDIYRHWTDPTGTTTSTSQAVLIWNTIPCSCWGFGAPPVNPNSQDPAGLAYAVARCGIRDSQNGIVLPAQAVYDTTTAQWYGTWPSVCREPDKVLIRYNAGRPLINGQIDPRWQVIIARLAAAELARPICACDSQQTRAEIHRWQYDLARTSGAADEIYGAISHEDLNNPLGTRRGHVQAWRAINQERQFVPAFTG